MRRKLAFIFLLVVLAIIGYLGLSIYDQLQEKQAVKDRIAALPEFSVADLNGKIVSSNQAKDQSSLVLTYFNTGCDFCKAEIRSMKEHNLLQQSASIWLVSDEPANILTEFASAFKLDSLQSIQVLQDVNKEVKQLFGVEGVPNTFVYGKDGTLLKSFKGETKAEVLYQLIK